MPEEYGEMPRQNKAHTQQDSQEKDAKSIPIGASELDQNNDSLTDHRFDDEDPNHPAGDKST